MPVPRTDPQPSSPPTSPTASPTASGTAADAAADAATDAATRDIADVAAVEIITTAAVHLMSAAAVKCGLSADSGARSGADDLDLDEARKLITALAGLITAAAPDLGNQHARSLRDGLRSLQLAFREASPFPDAPGEGPGENLTGHVS